MERTSFALESTLSGVTYLERIQRLKGIGCVIQIIFQRLSGPELAIKRVAHRVKQGGHHVPAEDVRRRFARGWRNSEVSYRRLADVWAVYENSGPTPVLVEQYP